MLQWHVRLVIFTKIILYCIISNSNWKSCCELSLETTVASGRIRLEIKLVSFSDTLKNMSHSNIRQFKTIFLPGTGMFNCFSLLSLHWFQYLNKWILAIGIAISKSRVCISHCYEYILHILKQWCESACQYGFGSWLRFGAVSWLANKKFNSEILILKAKNQKTRL